MSASFARPVKRCAFRLQRAEYIGFHSHRPSAEVSGNRAKRFPPRQDLSRTTPSQDREVQQAEGTEKPCNQPTCALTRGTRTAVCLAADSLAKTCRVPYWAVAPPRFPEHCTDISHQAVNELPSPKGRIQKKTSNELGLGCGGSRATS